MKPFLGTDLTTNKKNTRVNGSEFLVQQTSPLTARSLKDSTEKADAAAAKSRLWIPLRILQYICGFATLILIKSYAEADVSLAQAHRNAPWLSYITVACFVIWLVLRLWGRQKAKMILSSEESARTISRMKEMAQAVYRELGVPEDAKTIDILTFSYKIKDNSVKEAENGQFVNPAFRIFSDAEYLYLADLNGKYAFPKSAITGIQTVKQHIWVLEWNKDEPHNKGIYKPYKLTGDDYDRVRCKQYHILEINYYGTLWGIYFPSYELPIFENETGLKAL